MFGVEEIHDLVRQYRISRELGGRALQTFQKCTALDFKLNLSHAVTSFLNFYSPLPKKPFSESIIKPSFGKSFLSFQFIFRQSVYFSPAATPSTWSENTTESNFGNPYFYLFEPSYFFRRDFYHTTNHLVIISLPKILPDWAFRTLNYFL